MFPRFIWITLHCRNRYFLFFHSSDNWHLDCFHFLDLLLWTLSYFYGKLSMFLCIYLWSGIDGITWVTLFNSLRNCQTVFHSGCSASYSPSSVWGPKCLHILISTCYCPPLEPWSHYFVRGHISLCLQGKSGCKVFDKY
jgi:hypothetical protein